MNASTEIRLDALEHVVNGNGRPGLKTDVAVLQKDVSELGDIKSRLARVERSIYIGCGALLLAEFLFKLAR